MAKLDLTDLVSLANEPSAIQAINYNFQLLASAVENTLSRDGTSPNQMEANLDLNGKRLLNLPAPTDANQPARLRDVQGALSLGTAVIPPLDPGKALSNDGTALLWLDVSALGVGDMLAANNLSEVDPAPSRTNLGLTSSATTPQGTSGATYGLLNGNLTFSGANAFSGSVGFSGGATFGSGDYQLTSTTISDTSIGFRGAPPNTQDIAYQLAITDIGKSVVHTSATPHTWTIPPQASVAWPNGAVIVLANPGSGTVSVTRGSGVSLRIAGTSTDKNVSLVQHGIATLIRTSANTWYVSGAGVS